MNTMLHDTTTSTTLPAPAWATSEGNQGPGDEVLWSHKIELDAMEVDGPESMTVEAYVYDSLGVDAGGVTIERGSPEIMVTRHDTEDPDFCGGELRFTIANARKFAATILAACDAVEGTKATA